MFNLKNQETDSVAAGKCQCVCATSNPPDDIDKKWQPIMTSAGKDTGYWRYVIGDTDTFEECKRSCERIGERADSCNSY